MFLFVATLGYSRRIYTAPFRHERQSSWLEGIEGAFRHFGGLPGELLLDNASALVKHHDPVTREVEFNSRLHAFTRYWDVRPVACAPYRARTKGKDERGVGYVKHNAIAGRCFASWGALEAHLAGWMHEVADTRVHGTTGEAPIARFEREERQALRPLNGRSPFRQLRELTRRVQTDACVDVDTNHYSVPWRLIGAEVNVVVSDNQIRIYHAGRTCTASCRAAQILSATSTSSQGSPQNCPVSICSAPWLSMSRQREVAGERRGGCPAGHAGTAQADGDA